MIQQLIDHLHTKIIGSQLISKVGSFSGSGGRTNSVALWPCSIFGCIVKFKIHESSADLRIILLQLFWDFGEIHFLDQNENISCIVLRFFKIPDNKLLLLCPKLLGRNIEQQGKIEGRERIIVPLNLKR